MNETMRKLTKPIDWLFNRKFKKYVYGPNIVEVIGDRGVGKSTLFAMVSAVAHKSGLKVYCQYPMTDCYKIPVVEVDMGKYRIEHIYDKARDKWTEKKTWVPHITYQVDKHWLYTTDFHDCVVLIDECMTLWPARDFKSWGTDDSEFLNFARKVDLHLIICTQYYNSLDINIHRSVDEIWFAYKNGKSKFTHIEAYVSKVVPVQDLTKSVKLSTFSKEMSPLNWELCAFLNAKFLFWRPPYYDLFDTNFFYGSQTPDTPELWNDTIDELQSNTESDDSGASL